MYMDTAVIATGGKQYLVTTKAKIRIEKIDGKDGGNISFDKVLLVADSKKGDVAVGTPHVKGASVSAKLLSQGRAKKIHVIKYKNKIRYRRNRGHRQPFTLVEVTGIKQVSK